MNDDTSASEPLDLFDPLLRADPYPHYREVRDGPGFYRSAVWRGVVLMRYADVSAALQDERLSLGSGVAAMFDGLSAASRQEMQPLIRHVSRWLGALDTREHSRLQSVLSHAFSSRYIESLRPDIQRITDELIDSVLGEGQMELVSSLASPLPALTIALLMGTPIEDRERFRSWSTDITAFLGFGLRDVDTIRKAQASVLEMTEYLRGFLSQDDTPKGLLGRLVEAQKEGRVDEEELLANCVLLLFAGHETTSMLISNGVLALLKNPRQCLQLRSEPSLMTTAVNELLRYDPPLQMIRRVAVRDARIGGVEIAKGEFVWLMIGAANHDPLRFENPECLDLERRGNAHLSFGAGRHYCLGAALSKVEAEVAIGTLLRDFPNLRLSASPPEWSDNPTTRGLRSLEIEFAAARTPRWESKP